MGKGWRNWVACWACLLAAITLWPFAAAGHRLRVRARTSMTLTATDLPATAEIVIGGRLLDARGRGVSGRPVSVRVTWLESGAAVVAAVPTPGAAAAQPKAPGEMSRTVTTGINGVFRTRWKRSQLPLRTGRLQVHCSFFGNDTFAGAEQVTLFDLAQARGQVRLEVEPMRSSTDLTSVKVAVFAGVEGQPLAGRRLKLQVDGRPLNVFYSGPDGWVERQVAMASLLPPGTRRLSVEMSGSRDVSAARAEVAIEVAVAVDVALALRQQDCPEGRICLQGRVLVHRGDGHRVPPTAAAVMIDAERVRLGHVPLREDGRFAVSLNAEALSARFAPGPLPVVALAEVPQAFHLTGLSEVVAVDVPPPPSLSHWLYLGLIALVVLGMVWRRWQDRRRERRIAEELAAAAAGLPVQSVRRSGAGGIDLHGVRGVVLHGETGRPVAARVLVTPVPVEGELLPGEMAALDCPDGQFRLGPLAAGSWQLEVSCAEHETLNLALELPHDGTFDGCEVLPNSCRALVRSALGRAVRRRTGKAVDWWQETPRAVEPRWRAALRRGHREARAAVAAAERALYGRKTEPGDLHEVRSAIERVEEVQR